MESKPDQPPLVVIVGQTASGKSSLALMLAERFKGEIICADSRTVYEGMDIATAKPSAADKLRVHHHLLDIIGPNKVFTAADFQKQAVKAIADIASRGRLPIMVGGSGLYIDAVLFDFSFRPVPDADRRKQLEALSVDELQATLRRQGIAMPANSSNPRHLIRTIESGGRTDKKSELRENTLVIGLELEKEVLATRITARVDAMLSAGLESEALGLIQRYGWNCPPLHTIGYQEFKLYLEKQATLAQARQAIIQSTIQYAKRQKTWFKRNVSINWISKTEEAVDLLTTYLNK